MAESLSSRFSADGFSVKRRMCFRIIRPLQCRRTLVQTACGRLWPKWSFDQRNRSFVFVFVFVFVIALTLPKYAKL